MSPPETHRLILNVAAAQHELETVAILMSSIGAVVAQARQNDYWRGFYAGERQEYDRQERAREKLVELAKQPIIAPEYRLRWSRYGDACE